MSTGELSTVVSGDQRRNTIVNLKHISALPLRNALQSFDKNGDGKIDICELQKIVYWYGLWKYASMGLCLVMMILVWSTFGLTVWAINLTKDYWVTDGVLTGGDEVVKMSVASTYIPLNWATLLDRRHLDSLDSLTIEVAQSSGKFTAGIYHMKVASYLHANSTYLKIFGTDGSRVWVNSGTVVLYHPTADEAIMVCGVAACNTLAVDVKPDYLQQLIQRSAALFESSADFELAATVEGVAINKADGEGVTCMATIGQCDGEHGLLVCMEAFGNGVGQLGSLGLNLKSKLRKGDAKEENNPNGTPVARAGKNDQFQLGSSTASVDVYGETTDVEATNSAVEAWLAANANPSGANKLRVFYKDEQNDVEELVHIADAAKVEDFKLLKYDSKHDKLHGNAVQWEAAKGVPQYDASLNMIERDRLATVQQQEEQLRGSVERGDGNGLWLH